MNFYGPSEFYDADANENRRQLDCRQMFTNLVGVTIEVKVLQEASGELAEQCIVGFVDGP